MPGHDEVRAGRGARHKRGQVPARELAATLGQDRQLGVAVRGRVPMPGEVLERGGDAGRPQPAYSRGDLLRHGGRVRAVRPGADHPAAGVAEHVCVGGEVHVLQRLVVRPP